MGVPLRADWEEALGLPVVVENDVNARAVGEMVFGVARGCRDFVLFALGTDLGGGIVIDGKLHRGAHYIAAEFGHLTLDLDGPPCLCGGVGCAREWVSGAGLADKAGEAGPALPPARVSGRGKHAPGPAAQVLAAAREGNPAAENLVSEFSRRFGAAIANVMKVLDPELVVLAGEPIRAEPWLLTRKATGPRETTSICPSSRISASPSSPNKQPSSDRPRSSPTTAAAPQGRDRL
jgi:glucokinase